MHNNTQLIAQLKRDEGFSPVPYHCRAGKLTIGYGHNLDANPVPGLNARSKITREAAERLLVLDIQTVCAGLDRQYPWWRNLDDARAGVLVNMAFNLGLTKMADFHVSLGLIRDGQYQEAASNLARNPRWRDQIRGRLDRICAQVRSGEWV